MAAKKDVLPTKSTRISSASKAKGVLRPVWSVLWRTGLFFLVFSVCQVLYVRFFPPLTTLTMLSRQGEALFKGQPYFLAREWVDLEALPSSVPQAVVTGEDALFYEHWGFDFDQIAKAWAQNQQVKSMRGASTISQQTARNLFLWQQRSWLRKGLEAYYTALLELMVPKARILELYLNVAEWGDRVFGVEAASRRYFRKASEDLSREEAASLAASLPNPRKYPPDGGSKFQRRRKNIILGRMDRLMPREALRVTVREND